jgi:hypothetical protein
MMALDSELREAGVNQHGIHVRGSNLPSCVIVD